MKELRNNHNSSSYFSTKEILEYLSSDYKPDRNIIRRFLVKRYLLNEKSIGKICKASEIIEENEIKNFEFRLLSKTNAITEQFKWDDEKIYDWIFVRKKSKLIFSIAISFIFWISSLSTWYLILSLVALISSWFSIFVAIVLIAVLIKVELESRYIKNLDDVSAKQNMYIYYMKNSDFILLLPPSILTGLYIFTLSSDLFPAEMFFEGNINKKIDWFLYSMQVTLDTIFYDATETIGISLSNINPINLTGRICRSILNLLLVYSVIQLSINIYKKNNKSNIQFSGTLKDCYSRFYNETAIDVNENKIEVIKCLGVQKTFESPIVLVPKEFEKTFKEDFKADLNEVVPWA